MRRFDEVFIVFNKIELRIFSNSKLAHEMACAISGKLEVYSSPTLVLYRLQELVSQNPTWDITKTRINDTDLSARLDDYVKCTAKAKEAQKNQTKGGIPIMDMPTYRITCNVGGEKNAPYCG